MKTMSEELKTNHTPLEDVDTTLSTVAPDAKPVKLMKTEMGCTANTVQIGLSIFDDLFYFEKVSFDEFVHAMKYTPDQFEQAKKDYEDLKLPCASTTDSAGYDFYAPRDYKLFPGMQTMIPTGIRFVVNHEKIEQRIHVSPYVTNPIILLIANMMENIGLHLDILPRSSIGRRSLVRISNTIGLVDADYYKSDNEGHIFVCLYLPSDTTSIILPKNPSQRTLDGVRERGLLIERGTAFAQGVVGLHLKHPKFTSRNERNGGFGSTSK